MTGDAEMGEMKYRGWFGARSGTRTSVSTQYV